MFDWWAKDIDKVKAESLFKKLGWPLLYWENREPVFEPGQGPEEDKLIEAIENLDSYELVKTEETKQRVRKINGKKATK